MDRDFSRSRAILIGNAYYQADPRIENLPAARACVTAMMALLTGELCGWPKERIVDLVDVATPDKLARQVISTIRDAEDVLIFYYVGHGLVTVNGQLALALRETDRDPETLPHTAALYENLARILSGCRAPTKLVILDCCNAELGGRANYLFQGSDPAEVYSVDGLYFIGASKKYKPAKTPVDGELTCFTQALVDVVRDGIPGQPADLRLDQIFVEMHNRLTSANLPEPVESGIRGARQYPFARNAATPATSFLARLNSPNPEIRLGAVSALEQLLADADRARAATARQELRKIADTGVPRVAAVARELLTAHPNPSSARSSLPEPDARPLVTPVLSRTLGGRIDGIGRLAFSPDSRRLASVGDDKAVWVWDTAAGTHLSTTECHTGGVLSVAFSPDGRLLASASDDKAAWLWDPATGRLLGTLRSRTLGILSVAFSPDGRLLASGRGDGTVWLWDSTAVRYLHTLYRHSGRVWGVAFSPDGRRLASVSDDSTVRLWNPATGKLKRTLTGHGGGVKGVAFSPDRRFLASASDDSTVRLWDPATGERQHTLTGHAGEVTSVAFSPDGRFLASASLDATVRLWDLRRTPG